MNINFKKDKLRLWYNKPALDWENQALPIGNGYMGGMIFWRYKNRASSIQ